MSSATSLRRENELKRNLEAEVKRRLGFDDLSFDRMVEKVRDQIGDMDRVCIAGAAGSMKSTFAKKLADAVGVRAFDLDEYIVGGWEARLSQDAYRRRLAEGVMGLWQQLPGNAGWIVEHVHAASPLVVDLLRPTKVVILSPSKEKIIEVARARAAAAKDLHGSDGKLSERLSRAIDTFESSKREFNKAPGKLLSVGPGWAVKSTGYLS